jgi:heavy metal sensor kinase
MRRWWQQRSLRFRLALWYALGGTLLLTAFSAAIYVYVAGTMARPLDHQLRQDLAQVQQRMKVLPGREITWNGSTVASGAPWKWSDPWFELWDEEGRLVCRLWALNERELDQRPYAPVRNRETISVFSVAPDLRLRVLSMPYLAAGQDAPWMIRVMRVHEPTEDALSALLLILTIALPVVVALLVLGGYVVTKRWLKPLDDMVNEADRITADNLGRRLPVKNAGDELGRLASVFNVTLDRLEGSFRALDRFVADASHEMRTPLTTLRSVGEVALRRGRTPEEYREIIGSMLEEAGRLQLLTERLLELARTEGGAQAAPRRIMRLDTCISECLNELGILAENKQQPIAADLRECSVETDPVIFRQALQNLIDNAVKYSPAGTVITVSTAETDGWITVMVADQGPGIAEEHRTRITDRFFRADAARARDQGGFGLGLALTSAYMRILGGRLEFEPVQPIGSRFLLILPKG